VPNRSTTTIDKTYSYINLVFFILLRLKIMANINLDLEFQQLREEYFTTVIDTLENVEQNTLAIKSDNCLTELLPSIFREIHSLKGGSSSLEMPALEAILHQYEDYLTKKKSVDNYEDFIDKSLDYIDHARSCADDYKRGNLNQISKYASYATALSHTEHLGKVLIVDSSKSIIEAQKQVLEKLNIDYIVCNDGLKAFNRAAKERFDLIVVSKNLEGLDGVSIVSAIKLTNNRSQDVPLAMVTSDSLSSLNFKKNAQAEYLIKKDSSFIDNFTKIVQKSILHICEEHTQELKSLLYIEDDKILQKMFSLKIKKTDKIKGEVVATKQEALQVLESFIPDLILLDNFLKDENGEDVLIELSKNYPHIPVIFLTASPELIELSKLKKKGNVIAILEKPFNLSVVQNKFNNKC